MDDWIDVEKAKRVRQELRVLRSQKQAEADLLLEKDAVLRNDINELTDRISHIGQALSDVEADMGEDLIQHHRNQAPGG